jgi:predicted enzyme related to lactoylglutathione lyase
MPERTSYTQGTPNWVDLPTSDQAAAKAFYAGLFGWTYALFFLIVFSFEKMKWPSN